MKERHALLPDSQRKPALARAEIVDKSTRRRFEVELESSLKRKNAGEAKLAGALRAVASLSPALRVAMAEATSVMLRRGSFTRELYSACIRSLSECEDRHTTTLLKAALSGDEAGGAPALSAACFSRDPALTGLLSKLAASRQSHLAFGAETARVVRNESNGAHLVALAPMIKESHRISLCVDLFVPLVRAEPVSDKMGPALTVLRGAERHLGRWLVLGEVAAAAGDPTPIDEARDRASSGPSSARAAWSLVTWALLQRAPQVTGQVNGQVNGKVKGPWLGQARGSVNGQAQTGPQAVPQMGGGGRLEAPQTRPTVELVARLSDRPSADRDTTFLFRMARAGAASAKPMLETLVRTMPLADEVAVRAALYLARDHGRADLEGALVDLAAGTRREDLRGVAAAAMWDLGIHDKAREVADDLLDSKTIGNVAWGTLIRAAASRRRGEDEGPVEEVLTEARFRWIQWGWLE